MVAQQSRTARWSWGLVVVLLVALGVAGALALVPTLAAKAQVVNPAHSYAMVPAPDLGDLLRRLGSR
jgi:hypothetical protein